MRLRTLSTPRRSAGRRPAGRRLLAALVLALVLAAVTGGSSSAGVSDYSGTLHLSGPAISGIAGSWGIIGPAGPTGLVTPAISNGGAGSLSGSYVYIYTMSSGGATSASTLSNSITVTSSSISVANVPIGASLYRQRTNTPLSGTFQLVTSATNASPYVDNTVDASVGPGVLPQADTRLQTGAVTCTTTGANPTCGWADFAPGTGLTTTSANSSVVQAPVFPTACKGWVVNGGGDVGFASGVWTFAAKVKSTPSPSGIARLAVGMFKINGSGAPSGGSTWLLDPTASENTTTNLLNSAGTVTSLSVSGTAPTFWLGSTEHVCVQFYRHQTVPGGGARLLSLLAWDPSTAITAHPAPSAFANVPTPSVPANGASLSAVPTLQAGYSDPEGDTGTVTFELCADSTCSGGALQTSAVSATSGGNATWTPAFQDGTYWWRAKAKDATGPDSAWSAARSFTLATTPSATPGASPAAGALVTSVTLSGTFNDPNASDVGSLEFRVCPNTLCLTVTASQSVAVANGGTGTWSPTIADGLYYWQLRAVDGAGNASAWSASRSFTLDSTPPDTTIGAGGPADPTKVTSATFSFSGSESGSTFECSLDGGGFSSCTSPKTYTGLGEAPSPHTFHVRAIDSVGNVDPTPAVYVWKVDTTAPDTSIGAGKPAALSNTASPSFDLVSTESGSTFRCSLDGAAYASCTTPKSYTNLADGAHTFAVQATDEAGNVDGSPASYSWTIDTRAPETTLGSSRPSAKSNSKAASFTFSSTDTGASFECSSDGGAYTPCATPRAISGLVDGSHSFAVRAVDAAGNADATPASYGWSVDTIVPQVPDTPAPGEETWRQSATLSAVFVDPTFGSSGAVDFRLCADALCANVVASGTSGVVANGTTADWTPSPKPADGHYFWQARARDVSGNQSAWSGPWELDLDATPPSAPPHFNGVVAEDGLTLRWDPVLDTVANYVVFVDGTALVNLGAETYELKLGAFDAGDPRRFSVVAVDRAGNVGTASPVLVGVPNLIGLTMTAASDALSSRGLHVKQSAALVHTGVATIVAQDPSAATLAEQGSSVQVLLADGIGGATPLSITAGPVKARCVAGSRIKLHLRLSDRADVSWTVRGVRGAKGRLGTLSAGSNDVRIELPKSLRSGRTYVLDLHATSETRTARASVKVVAARTSGVCGAR